MTAKYQDDNNSNSSVVMDNNITTVRYFELFRFAQPLEYFLLFMGFLFTLAKALSMPCIIIIYSEFISMLVDRSYGQGTTSKTYFLPLLGGGNILINGTKEANNQELYNDSIAYGILFLIFSIVFFICGIFAVDIFNYVGLKQISRMRIKYFEALIRREIGWHDKNTSHNFGLTITDQMEKIRDGIAEKIHHFGNLLIGFIVMIILSFIYGWKLTLAISAYVPIVIVTQFFVSSYQNKLTTKELNLYSLAGNLLEEILSGIRTVIAFGGEKSELKRYETFLSPARTAGKYKGAFSGLSEGVVRSLMFVACSGAFWYGVNLILADRDKDEKEYTPAIMLIAFIGIIVGADNVSRSSPFLESFVVAKSSAKTIFKTIDSKSKIDPLSENGKCLNVFNGSIEFQDVFFRYPSRENVTVLRGLNMKIENGTTVALVGSSGCGKSTCIQLMQRFYDPIFGNILVDGMDIRKYKISWLRSQLAIVGQEPVLFQGTIGENIKFGNIEASQKQIEESAKLAGAHEFIKTLPDAYETWIGEKGTQLSGGQKQRIAIARALIQNPKILLLDEATSALDYTSEKLIQETLDNVSKGRTTIVVSHRLSAIKNADKIVFIGNGKVLEEGTHDELMTLQENYFKMVTSTISESKDANVTNLESVRKKSLEMTIYEKTSDYNKNNFKGEMNRKRSSQINLKHKDSLVNDIKKTNDVDVEQKVAFGKAFVRIIQTARPEWDLLFCGTVCALAVGLSYPALTMVFAEFYGALADPVEENALRRTAFISIVCLAVAFLIFLVCSLQIYLFNLSGISLTTRLRTQAFESILRQEMGWFDQEQNSVGVLSARLAGDAANVQGATGFPLSGIFQAIATFVASISIAFYYQWKLSLLCSSMIPFIIGSVIFEAKFVASTTLEEKKIIESASRVATEAIIFIKTVAGLRREKVLIENFSNQINKVEKLLMRKLRFRGLVNSCGQSAMYFGYAAALCYGGVLTSRGEMDFQDILKVSETLLYGSMMLAQSLAFIPAFTAALIASQRLFEIIDRNPKIISPKPLEKNQALMNYYPGVKYENIEFRYPTRPDIQVLNGLQLEVLKGKSVALVGHSGCGKSTCIQLLQRFYDPDAGKIQTEDGVTTDLNLKTMRSKLGIVSQEPILFERTIAENIAYGDNLRDVPLSEVIEAAKHANAHDFITLLPTGYNTCLGSRGTQLSGGQKQRIAIARALVRNPEILLLDEATSALDLQSEQLVQTALDSARSGRTCIIIAHRLSTVKNADLICVFDDGKITEYGTHHELLNRKGLYYKLYQTQPKLDD